MTPDGRFIVFSSIGTTASGNNLGTCPPGGTAPTVRQIYRFEQSTASTTGTYVHISKWNDGSCAVSPPTQPPIPGDCDMPSISNDGKRVVFQTRADLDPADANDLSNTHELDIYLRDLTNPNSPVTVRLTGPRFPPLPRGDSFGAAISGDGQYVAFTSTAQDLSPTTDTNGPVEDVYRVKINADGSAGPIVFVSISEAGPVAQCHFQPMSTIGVSPQPNVPGCPIEPLPAPLAGCPGPAPSGCSTPAIVLGVGGVISDDGSRILFHGAPAQMDWCCDQKLCPDPNLDNNCINTCNILNQNNCPRT